ncbi:MAG: nucleotidyltransferase domain-containing protein [Nitrospirae bacterium]|nr:nucleotidyltransferase domain-containing protein [Nitrospirota bacterium]
MREAEGVCHVDKAILFGSHAHGRPSAQSDIDIAIFSKAVTDRNRIETMSKLLMLVSKLKVDIQPVVFPYEDYATGDNDFITEEIKKKGIEI